MTDNRTLNRIKKLLRLSKSANRHEADLAMARAFELAAMHHIAISDIDIDEDIRKIIDESIHVGLRVPLDRSFAISIISTYYNVTVIYDRPGLIIVGTTRDIEIAKYMLEYLTQSARRSLASYCKEEKKARRKITSIKTRNYTRGYFYGISSILRKTLAYIEQSQEQSAVATVTDKERQKTYIGKNFQVTPKRTQKKERINSNAINIGFSNGRNLSMNDAVGNSTRKQLL